MIFTENAQRYFIKTAMQMYLADAMLFLETLKRAVRFFFCLSFLTAGLTASTLYMIYTSNFNALWALFIGAMGFATTFILLKQSYTLNKKCNNISKDYAHTQEIMKKVSIEALNSVITPTEEETDSVKAIIGNL